MLDNPVSSMTTMFETRYLPLRAIADERQWIRAKQLGLVYQNCTLALTAETFCAFTTVFLLWTEVSARGLVLWLGAQAVLSLCRLMLQQSYHRHEPETAPEWYGTAYFVSVAAAGCLWGALSFWLFPELSTLHQAYLTFVLGGVCAGAATLYAPLPGAFHLFTLPALIPFVARIWIAGDGDAQMMSLLVTVFLLILMRASRQSSTAMREVLDLQVQNSDLTKALHHRATHDSLVDLVNHGEFNRRLDKITENKRAPSRPLSLIFIDLDHFKEINDSGGHAAGDALLIEVATILKSRTRSTDTTARVGGDEFALILDGCPSEKALEIGESIRAGIANIKINIEGKQFSVNTSIGIAFGYTTKHRASGMLKAADAACYRAKEEGRNRVCVNEASESFRTTGRFEITTS